MAEMEVIRSGILSHGAVTALVEHLTLSDAHILVSILQCLTMLVGDAEARAEVGGNDDSRTSSVAKILERRCAKSFVLTILQVCLTGFLSNLCFIKLHAAEGLQPLVDLLCSYDKEVLHHACLVINICATDEPSAIEMNRLG